MSLGGIAAPGPKSEGFLSPSPGTSRTMSQPGSLLDLFRKPTLTEDLVGQQQQRRARGADIARFGQDPGTPTTSASSRSRPTGLK